MTAVTAVTVRVLGVTGGIGAGKSRLARMLADLFGAPILDADKMGHAALEPGSSVHEAVLARFGDHLADDRGEISRSGLARIVFTEPNALADLERIVHPWILERIEARVAALKASGYAGIIVLDAALLLDWVHRFRPDGIAVVVASRQLRLARLEQRGLAPEEATRRMEHQRSDESWRDHADWVVENDGDLEDLQRAAETLWQEANARWGLSESEGEEPTDG